MAEVLADLEVDGILYADNNIEMASGKVLKVNALQVVGARVVDARIDDTPNSGDVTTDGIIAAIQAALMLCTAT